MRASIHSVCTAPGNFWESVFGPVSTGMAMKSSAYDQFLFKLRGWVDDQRCAFLGFQAIVRDHRALLGEPLGHLLFLGEVRLRNEEGEIRVDVAGVLEHAVEGALHLFPDCEAVRL